MKTNQRLDEALHKAHVIEFDSSSKFILLSDIHRGDDSVSDEFTKNRTIFLRMMDYYYDHNFHYIEVGDGEDLWEYKEFKVIRLAHADVYKRMKRFFNQGRLTIIYGNHNMQLKYPNYVKNNLYQFCDEFNENCEELFPGIQPRESVLLKNTETGKSFLVVHGHQGDLFNDQLWKMTSFFHHNVWRYLHVVGFRSPTSPAKVVFKRHRLEMNFVYWIKSRKQPVICGHTHRARFPRGNRAPYYNTGCAINTKGVTGIEIIDGNIQFVDWRTFADREGVVRVMRKILAGPRPI